LGVIYLKGNLEAGTACKKIPFNFGECTQDSRPDLGISPGGRSTKNGNGDVWGNE